MPDPAGSDEYAIWLMLDRCRILLSLANAQFEAVDLSPLLKSIRNMRVHPVKKIVLSFLILVRVKIVVGEVLKINK